jgi:hypothetical protein
MLRAPKNLGDVFGCERNGLTVRGEIPSRDRRDCHSLEPDAIKPLLRVLV